ncbi:MAG: hypothetical protein EOO68_03485 [Moraxellaceae bacterium]|jgi:predicted hotdog family 3-hydroxylacyl-ACP dehydratase|nr:MAG: hypothetical protein EOO68_03485 [Moraxellaceae bacterium]
MLADQRLKHAYTLLPHGQALQVISALIDLTPERIHCIVQAPINNPLCDQANVVSSFSCIEYAAQAAAIHGILMGANYNPLKPAFIGAVKDLQLARSHYASTQTVTISAQQEYSENDGAIYSFSGDADGERLLSGRLILKK